MNTTLGFQIKIDNFRNTSFGYITRHSQSNIGSVAKFGCWYWTKVLLIVLTVQNRIEGHGAALTEKRTYLSRQSRTQARVSGGLVICKQDSLDRATLMTSCS